MLFVFDARIRAADLGIIVLVVLSTLHTIMELVVLSAVHIIMESTLSQVAFSQCQ